VRCSETSGGKRQFVNSRIGISDGDCESVTPSSRDAEKGVLRSAENSQDVEKGVLRSAGNSQQPGAGAHSPAHQVLRSAENCQDVEKAVLRSAENSQASFEERFATLFENPSSVQIVSCAEQGELPATKLDIAGEDVVSCAPEIARVFTAGISRRENLKWAGGRRWPDGRRRKCVVDSGATHTICGDIRMFSKLGNRTFRVQVADRIIDAPAVLGELRPNSLGIVHALYHPDISTMLVSVCDLESAGKRVEFAAGARKITFADGRTTKIRHPGLPMADCVFFDEQSEGILNWGDVDNAVGAMIALSEINFEELTGVSELARVFRLSAAKRLLQHQRAGHFYTPGVSCDACDLSKTRGCPKDKKRSAEYLVEKFLDAVDADWTGPWPDSKLGSRFCLDVLDQATGWAESYPVASRSEAADILLRFCKEIGGVPSALRTDNALEFRAPSAKWRQVAEEKGIKVSFSAPYSPWMNGRVERHNGTHSSATRAVLSGVDPSVWDWAAKFVSYSWNRRPNPDNGISPYEKRLGKAPGTEHFRRFGCLAYQKVHVLGGLGKLANRFVRGVSLGYSRENSAYLVGSWQRDNRLSAGIRFVVSENRVVKFREDILVKDINALRSDEYRLCVDVASDSPVSVVQGDLISPPVLVAGSQAGPAQSDSSDLAVGSVSSQDKCEDESVKGADDESVSCDADKEDPQAGPEGVEKQSEKEACPSCPGAVSTRTAVRQGGRGRRRVEMRTSQQSVPGAVHQGVRPNPGGRNLGRNRKESRKKRVRRRRRLRRVRRFATRRRCGRRERK